MIVDFAFIDFNCSSGCLLHLLYAENHLGAGGGTRDSNFIVALFAAVNEPFIRANNHYVSAIHYCSFLPTD